MLKNQPSGNSPSQILSGMESLLKSIEGLGPEVAFELDTQGKKKRFTEASSRLLIELDRLRDQISPGEFGRVAVSLGRADGIAKFFAFSFVNREKRPLRALPGSAFSGSGIYAIYYHGRDIPAYAPVSGSETPIYVGKANPANPYAETVEEQGAVLYRRLKEHAKNIGMTSLTIDDFSYRAATIQSGMQAAVEEFLIRLFRPIWNKEIRICYGIGKHGDSATTRANKRSPWDTMHPGRAWAEATISDQASRDDIEKKIAAHFEEHGVIRDKDALFKMLSLGG